MKKHIETSSGFEAEVNAAAADDLAFLDLLCALDDGEPHAIRGIVNALLDEPDRERLYAHLKTEDGRVPVSAVTREMIDIINGIGKK